MKIKLVLAAVLLVVLAVIAIGVLSCGDDDDEKRATGTAGQRSSGQDGDDGATGGAPALKTLGVKRSEGKNAAAAAAGFTEKPKEFWLRISAAPKQPVKGSWNVSCAGGAIDQDTFEVTPPHLMQLRVPDKKARSCIAGASAQLKGEGRLKVTILRDR